jgi:hypothetical protein
MVSPVFTNVPRVLQNLPFKKQAVHLARRRYPLDSPGRLLYQASGNITARWRTLPSASRAMTPFTSLIG